MSRGEMDPAGRPGGGRRQRSLARSGWGSVLVPLLLISGAVLGGASRCQKASFKYTSGGCDGHEFEVSRCAADTASLQAYLEGLLLNEVMTANQCKTLWLEACSSFYQSSTNPAVVVARQIVCNRQVCDQSPYYSNCEADTDCTAIATVADGPPYLGYAWPWSQSNITTLPRFRPCCDFWESYCNGASCSGREPSTGANCPLTDAYNNGFCMEDDCWWAGAAPGPLVVPTGLAALLALAASLLSMRQ